MQSAAPALVVPEDSIVTFAGTERALTIATNTAVEKRITTGRRENGFVEVLKGLRPGERVIRRPEGIQSGDPVTPSSASGPGPMVEAQKNPKPLNAEAR